MGFIKFLFQIAFWLFVIVVGFISFGIMLDNFESFPIWLQLSLFPFIIFVVFGLGLWKFWLILFGVYKVKEELKK